MEFCLVSLFGWLFVLAVVFLISALVVLYLTSMPYPSLSREESEKYFIEPDKDGQRVSFPSLLDPPSVDLSVIVPAYNEEERLPGMLDEATEYLEDRQKSNRSFTYEIIVVDDGSKDKTSVVALKYSEKFGTNKIRVLTLARNRGKGGAVRLGMFVGRGKSLLFADADGASKFSDIQKLEDNLHKINKKSNNMAVVCGSRSHLEKESIAERTFFRTVLMYGFHVLVYTLCVRGVKDTQCGFKLLTREAAVLLFSNMHVERWAFDVELLYLAQYFGIPIGEVCISWQEIEGSKMVPFWSWAQMGKDLLLIRLRYMIGAWKIRDSIKSQ